MAAPQSAPSRRTFLRGTAAAAAVLALPAAVRKKHRTGIYQATYTATY